jgi:hypothetical protein
MTLQALAWLRDAVFYPRVGLTRILVSLSNLVLGKSDFLVLILQRIRNDVEPKSQIAHLDYRSSRFGS